MHFDKSFNIFDMNNDILFKIALFNMQNKATEGIIE